MLKKRVRGSNFNAKEEDILIKCVLRHISVIENKRTDAPTLREKQHAWEKVRNKFNSLCPDDTRHTKALKDKYTNIKTMLRKKFAADKANHAGNDSEEWRLNWRPYPRSETLTELVNFLSIPLHENNSPNLDSDYDDEDYDYESHDSVLPPIESCTAEYDDVDEKPFDSINLETIEIPHHHNSDSGKNGTMDNIFPTNLSQSSTNKSWSADAPSIQRKRAINFTVEEENILIKCVLRHASIIENKRIDAAVLRKKQRVWEEIGCEFNALCPNVARQTKALKDKYTNLKTSLRKQFEAEKANRKATNFGMEMPEWRPKSEAMAELAKLLSYSFSAPSTAMEYDDDDDYDNESQDAILPSVESFAVESDDGERPFESNNHQTIEVLLNDNSDNSKNNQRSNRSQLKQIPSAASSSHSEMEISLQGLKKKLIKRTLQMREIEHQTRLSQQQREHEARLALLEAQKMDFESKVKLRQLKIAKFSNEKIIKTEVNIE